MKNICWSVVGTMLSTSLLAQPVSNPPPATAADTAAPAVTNAAPAPPVTAAPTAEATAMTNVPAAAASAPAAKSAKKKSGKKNGKGTAKKSAPLQTTPLAMGPAFVIANNVNVRGQPKLKSEVVGRLTNQEPVTVIEEIVRNDSGPDEPSAWAKIHIPAGVHTWVSTSFIDPTTKTVKASKLRVRSGAGENYSVIGTLQKGDPIKEVTTKGDWTEIEAPAGAYAFVAAQYLRQEAAAPVATLTEPARTNEAGAAAAVAAAAVTTTAVTESPAVASTTTETPSTNSTTTSAAAAAAAATETDAASNTVAEAGATNNATSEATAPPEPPPKRIVSHEGYVRGTTSIQAPTSFALVSPENGRTIDYLFTDSPGLDLRRYKGMRIIVTGEEAIEDRWPNTPVITIEQQSRS